MEQHLRMSISRHAEDNPRIEFRLHHAWNEPSRWVVHKRVETLQDDQMLQRWFCFRDTLHNMIPDGVKRANLGVTSNAKKTTQRDFGTYETQSWKGLNNDPWSVFLLRKIGNSDTKNGSVMTSFAAANAKVTTGIWSEVKSVIRIVTSYNEKRKKCDDFRILLRLWASVCVSMSVAVSVIHTHISRASVWLTSIGRVCLRVRWSVCVSVSVSVGCKHNTHIHTPTDKHVRLCVWTVVSTVYLCGFLYT